MMVNTFRIGWSIWNFDCIRYTQCQITGSYAGLLAMVIWEYSFYTSYTSGARPSKDWFSHSPQRCLEQSTNRTCKMDTTLRATPCGRIVLRAPRCLRLWLSVVAGAFKKHPCLRHHCRFGNGGQQLLVVPQHHLVVTVFTGNYNRHRADLFNWVLDRVVLSHRKHD